MRTFIKLSLIFGVFGLCGAGACDNDNDTASESASETMDDMGDSAKDTVEDAGDSVEDATDE